METHTCSLCDWQSGTPAEAYRHLAQAHDLGSYRGPDRVETEE
jgi:hypothetical protein